jgi:hypothetical protein
MTAAQKASDIRFFETQIESLAYRLDRGQISTAHYVATRAHVQEMLARTMAAEVEDEAE